MQHRMKKAHHLCMYVYQGSWGAGGVEVETHHWLLFVFIHKVKVRQPKLQYKPKHALNDHGQID